MADLDDARRRFMAHFASAGPGAPLGPGIVAKACQDAAGFHLERPSRLDR